MVGSAREKNIKQGVFLLLCTLSLSAHKQEDFLAANQLYEKGEYSAALTRYNGLSDKGYGVYHNMGNAYYKQGNYLQALVYWKKAQRLAHGGQVRAVLESIKKAEEKLRIPSDSFSYQVAYFLGPYISYVPMLVVQALWLLFILIFLVSLVKCRGYTRILHAAFCSIMLISFGTTILLKRYTQCPEGVLIAEKSVSLFAGPNDQYHQVAPIAKGNLLYVCQQSDDWYKVTCGSKAGWISSSAVIVI